MAKRSTNFNGMKKWRSAGAADLIATFRFLGMSDDEIMAKLLEMKDAKDKPVDGKVDESQNSSPASAGQG